MSRPDNKTVILVTHDGMGQADTALQHKLAGKFFQLLRDDGKLPAVICFYTDGVKLVCDGSPVLDHLRALEDAGVRLIVCNTCLNHFGLAGGQGHHAVSRTDHTTARRGSACSPARTSATRRT